MTDEEWKTMKEDDEYITPSVLEFIRAIPDFEDRGTEQIAADCKCSTQTVRNWQKRFKEEGMLDMTM